MKYERGIYRALFVVSIPASILGFILYMNSTVYPSDDDFGYAVVIGSVFFALPWAIYFIVLWIIKGFRDDEKKK